MSAETEYLGYVPSIQDLSEGVEATTNSHEIPDHVMAELHSLETSFMAEEILQQLMDVDDDFLDALATQIDADVNFFNYNRELDTWNNSNEINLFDHLSVVSSSQSTQRMADAFSSEIEQQVEVEQDLTVAEPSIYSFGQIGPIEIVPQQQKQNEELQGINSGEPLTSFVQAQLEQKSVDYQIEEPIVMIRAEKQSSTSQMPYSQLYKIRSMRTKNHDRPCKRKNLLSSKDKTNEKLHVCDKCFNTKQHLLSHATVHTGVKPYECDVCMKTFRYRSYLERHKIKHTGVKPHCCDECNKTFKHESDLKFHKKYHSDGNPNECKICSKTFRYPSCVRIHSLMHTDKIKCEICGLWFRHEHSLKRHLKFHDSRQPYKCEYCEKRFPCTSNLSGHMRRYHFSQQKKSDGKLSVKT